VRGGCKDRARTARGGTGGLPRWIGEGGAQGGVSSPSVKARGVGGSVKSGGTQELR